MSEETTRRDEVRVGDTVYRLAPFKGSKGVRAFAIVSRVYEQLKEVWAVGADFEREYRERNVMRISRDLARHRIVEAENVRERLRADLARLEPAALAQRRDELTEELRDAEAALARLPEDADPDEAEAARDERDLAQAALRDLDDAPKVRRQVQQAIDNQGVMRDEWQRYLDGPLQEVEELVVPKSPSGGQVTMAIFPKVWQVAEPEATMLLGLVLIPDEQLREARGRGGDAANEAVREFGETLLDELEIHEVAELLVTAVEYAVDRYRPRMARLEKRVTAVGETLMPSRSARTADEEEAAKELGPDRRRTEPLVGSVVAEETSPSQRSDSSTGSPAATDGASTESSSESSGSTSSPSPA